MITENNGKFVIFTTLGGGEQSDMCEYNFPVCCAHTPLVQNCPHSGDDPCKFASCMCMFASVRPRHLSNLDTWKGP